MTEEDVAKEIKTPAVLQAFKRAKIAELTKTQLLFFFINRPDLPKIYEIRVNFGLIALT